jgi:hypothetical protein
MAIASSCVSTMEKPRLWMTTSPESPTLLYAPNTPKGYIVRGRMTRTLSDTDNVIAALGLADRQSEKVLAAMQVPFPELTNLELFSNTKTVPVISDTFLNGSAPRLRVFDLNGILFPGLPKLLLSATHLVYFRLSNIPHSVYISPEAMVALLSVLSSLKTLILKFQSPQSRPDWESRRPPPSKRSVISALDYFSFKGIIKYLENLVTFIDAPQLNALFITSFDQIDFDTPRLAQFINSTQTLRALDEAHVHYDGSFASVKLRYRTSKSSFYHKGLM